MALDSLFAIARGILGSRQRRYKQDLEERELSDREAELARRNAVEDRLTAQSEEEQKARDQERRLRLYEGGYRPANTPDETVKIPVPTFPGLTGIAAQIALPRYEQVPGEPLKRDLTRTPEARARQREIEQRTEKRSQDVLDQQQALERIREQGKTMTGEILTRLRTEADLNLRGPGSHARAGGATPTALAGFYARAPLRSKFTTKGLTVAPVVNEDAYQQAVRAWRAGGRRLGLTEDDMGEVLEPGARPAGGGGPVVSPETPPPAPGGVNYQEELALAREALAQGMTRATVASRFKSRTGRDLPP